jgi:hypothetical protein
MKCLYTAEMTEKPEYIWRNRAFLQICCENKISDEAWKLKEKYT